ncbi:MAG: hypothetical protein HDT42_03530 [Ruminococcaceae bacterium]|nr:hypothetical protein [Oscillospiraceae bacterium]
MNVFRINFTLRPPAEIAPWGEKGDYLSWFGLTDSELWITVGERTIYEYTDAACKEWEHDIRHNDYYLSRFLEDFSGTFKFIRESVPHRYYDYLDEFVTKTDNWQSIYLDDDSIDDDAFYAFLEEKWEPLTEWFSDRVFDSGHLTGGPLIGFFRCGDMIKIRWKSNYTLENSENIWTAPSGFFEIPYADFVAEVKRFFEEFFAAMDKQVETALRMDWGKVKLDKTLLAKEHQKRKEGFSQAVALLDENNSATDWNKVDEMYEIMKKELSAEE